MMKKMEKWKKWKGGVYDIQEKPIDKSFNLVTAFKLSKQIFKNIFDCEKFWAK